MTDDEVAEIRRRKLQELKERAEGPDVPDEPIYPSNADEYDELVSRYDVVLVDFYADWCGPCKQLEPVIERLAAATGTAVLKVDVDAHRELAARMNVRGVPTLALYAGGEPVERLVGMQDEDRLRSLIERHA